MNISVDTKQSHVRVPGEFLHRSAMKWKRKLEFLMRSRWMKGEMTRNQIFLCKQEKIKLSYLRDDADEARSRRLLNEIIRLRALYLSLGILKKARWWKFVWVKKSFLNETSEKNFTFFNLSKATSFVDLNNIYCTSAKRTKSINNSSWKGNYCKSEEWDIVVWSDSLESGTTCVGGLNRAVSLAQLQKKQRDKNYSLMNLAATESFRLFHWKIWFSLWLMKSSLVGCYEKKEKFHS